MALPPFHPDSASLVKKHLTPERYQRLSPLKTSSGFTLDQAIRSGLVHPDSSVGIYAGDSESYALFSDIFIPIIQEYHGLDTEKSGHVEGTAPWDLRPLNLPPLDPGRNYIRSMRIRVARSLAAFAFPCHITREDRRELERRVMAATATLPEEIAGTYYRYSDLSSGELNGLIKQKLAFPKGDRFQEDAGMNRDFPDGRGVFLSLDKTFRIWISEEDHLRIMVQEESSEISSLFRRLALGLDHLNRALSFSFDPALGYLNACPTNVGTAMRAGVHIHLPRLNRERDRLDRLVQDHCLQIRGTMGEKTAVENAIFDISNARRLGVSASQIIQDLYQGLRTIIRTEKNL